MGLDLKIYRLPSPDPGFASRVGRSGFSFILVKVSLISRTFLLFDISLAAGKRIFICNYRFNI